VPARPIGDDEGLEEGNGDSRTPRKPAPCGPHHEKSHRTAVAWETWRWAESRGNPSLSPNSLYQGILQGICAAIGGWPPMQHRCEPEVARLVGQIHGVELLTEQGTFKGTSGNLNRTSATQLLLTRQASARTSNPPRAERSALSYRATSSRVQFASQQIQHAVGDLARKRPAAIALSPHEIAHPIKWYERLQRAISEPTNCSNQARLIC
jgi:hypothetical protein